MIRWNKGYWMIGLLLLTASLTGCSSEVATVKEVMDEIKTTNEADIKKLKLGLEDVILQVDSYNVTYKEVLFYIYQAKQDYEKKLSEQVWDVVLEDGDTLEEYAKQELLKQMTEVKIICLQANKEGISLTDEEKGQVKQNVTAFMDRVTESDKETYGLQEQTVEAVLQDNALAKKMYEKVAGQEKEEEKSDIFKKEYEKWSEGVELKMSVGLWKKIGIRTMTD